jgi:rSAM/selenodomain-associated transferase 1
VTESLDHRCILLFAKYPDQGAVKTRLAQDLCGIEAEELYRAFVLDTLSLLKCTGIPVTICCFPDVSQKSFAAWLGDAYRYLPQHGKDLGDRIKNCFSQAYSLGFEQVAALGTDIPDLPSAFVTEAFVSLKKDDAVIGPSTDGGYYLIGFKKSRFLPKAFNRIDWSTDRVFSQTMDRLYAAGSKTHVLPAWHDVDTLADLQELFQRGLRSEFETSRTMSLLSARNHSAFARESNALGKIS